MPGDLPSTIRLTIQCAAPVAGLVDRAEGKQGPFLIALDRPSIPVHYSASLVLSAG